eukprot:1393918-Amorphochlora_amoeboformis.AAC.2
MMNLITSVDWWSSTVFLSVPTFSTSDWDGGGSRYYVQNALEHLDEPDEFYIDALLGKILLFTKSVKDIPKRVVVAIPNQLITIEGNPTQPVRNVSFVNVSFAFTSVERECVISGCHGQGAADLTTAMVHLMYATDVHFHRCTFAHTGQYAVYLNTGTVNCSVTHSRMYDLGAGGLVVAGGMGHNISDNQITDGGWVWQMGMGVLTRSVNELTVTHNEVSFLRQTGISIGWTWGYGPGDSANIEVAYNHVHGIHRQ